MEALAPVVIVRDLLPPVEGGAYFRRDRARKVPDDRGCYALATIEGVILYVGLAASMRTRMIQHLDTPEKTAPTPYGRAVWFHWRHAADLERLERSWMNQHLIAASALPFLNKAYSPVHLHR